ncbi:hypothetical protein COCOBI_17-2570 [Coccomyxa sp. Obi]|nr:hypothetical protein COCOBI_17-2570 [Coccomyxa sp. Obi]
MVEAAAPPASGEAHANSSAGTSAVPLEPPQRHPKPDREAHKTLTNSLSEAIKARKKRINEIRAIIAEGRGSDQTGVEDGILKERNKTNKEEFKAVLEDKLEAKRSLEIITDRRDRFRNETRDMERQNPDIGSTEKIEAQIAKLQNRHDHTIISLKEKMKLLAEINKWEALRKSATAYAERIKTLEGMDAECTSASDELERLDGKLSTLQPRLDPLNEKLDEPGPKPKPKPKTQANIPLLQAELRKCRDLNTKEYKELKQLEAEFRAENDIYKDAEKKYWNWYDSRTKRRKEALEEARKQRIAESKKAHAYDAGNIFNEEVGFCDQLTVYLSKYVAADITVGAEDAATAEGPEIPEGGYKVLTPRDENVNVLSYSSVAARNVIKKEKKGADRKPDPPAEQKLVHSIDNLNAFSKLDIEAPLTTTKVPAVLDAVKARKEYFLAERAKKESGKVFKSTSKPDDNGDLVNGHTKPGRAGTSDSADGGLSPGTEETATGEGKSEELHFNLEARPATVFCCSLV